MITTAKVHSQMKAVQVPQYEEVVTLTMSIQQAETLLIVCSNIGGSFNSRRLNTHEIKLGLLDAGLVEPSGGECSGYLSFDRELASLEGLLPECPVQS